jgi:ligand-binding sensor domain-containing protein/serine phosphatase RsbU (regulator of sigma subunit)
LPEASLSGKFFLMKFSKYTFLVLVVLLLQVNFSAAQQYNFKNYTPKNGLASSIVNSIFQDSKGYIWFGTQGGGVSRFNGKVFKNFKKEDGLIDNDVTFITEDKKGNIWIASSGGVSMFNGVKFINYDYKNGLSKGVVYWIYVDDNNSIWFAVEDGGVNIFDGQKFRTLTTKDGLPSDRIFCITRDKAKNYWFGLSDGVAKYDGKKVTSFAEYPEIKKKTFFSTFVDSKGNIWFGGINNCGVVEYDGSNFLTLPLPEEVKNDFIGGISEDNKGNLWFATEHGVLKYDGWKFYLFGEKQGLASNAVLSVFHDNENNIWVGTQVGGVDVFNNESFVNYTEKDGLPNKNIIAVISESPETYIVGTPGSGLKLLNTKTNTFLPLTDAKEVEQSDIHTMMIDSKKQLWVGSQEGAFMLQKENGIYKLKKSFTKIDTTVLTAVIKILEDKNGIYWIASYGTGIMKIDGDRITQLNKGTGFISDNILSLFIDSKSTLWIGTKDEGVIRYDSRLSGKVSLGKKYKQYTTKDGLGDKAVWCITEDKRGNIYFGTNENGVSVFDGKHFKNFTTANGLCSNYVPALTYDSIGDCIWIGSEKGVNRLKLKQDLEIESIRYYGEQEGFKGIEVNQGAILLDKKGLLWLGTTNGLSRYDRKFDFPNVTPPILHLNGIRLAYQTVDWKNYTDSVDPATGLPVGLELSHKNNHLTFDFQAFTTDNVRYTFILEGQDEEWSPLTTNTEAVFTNITPGKTYTFKAKALNSNGIWSEDVIAFKFRINPPWWQTWWFYTLSVLVIVVSIYTYIRYRTAQHAREKKILEDKVTERTVELKSTNDKLSIAFQDIKDSINYAKKIQDAILPLEEEIKKALPDSFVLFKPRDVVSGDFYWFNAKDDKIFIAAVDCTGHGVPGAFMSMIGSSLLNEIISKKGGHDAASILKKLHQGVRKSLKQDRDSYESKDGMDLALAVIDTTHNTLQYAGAKRPLFMFRDGIFMETKADKQSIGGLEMEHDYHFTNNNFEIQKGDTFYLFTDGYVDQFGGAQGKKYSTKRLKDTVAEIQSLTMKEQGLKLGEVIDNWKIRTEQIDDILVIGLRF